MVVVVVVVVTMGVIVIVVHSLSRREVHILREQVGGCAYDGQNP